MPTTPTSIVNRLMGAEAFTDALNFGSVAQTLPAGTTIGGVTVDPSNRLVTVAAATTTLSVTQALHANKIILLQSTGGLVITPPAATGTGAVYEFIFIATITGGSVTIDAKAGNASDQFFGRCYQLKVGTGEVVYAAISTANLMTIDGSTRGGIKGDFIRMIDVATNIWYVFFDSTASGTVATPFTNH